MKAATVARLIVEAHREGARAEAEGPTYAGKTAHDWQMEAYRTNRVSNELRERIAELEAMQQHLRDVARMGATTPEQIAAREAEHISEVVLTHKQLRAVCNHAVADARQVLPWLGLHCDEAAKERIRRIEHNLNLIYNAANPPRNEALMEEATTP